MDTAILQTRITLASPQPLSEAGHRCVRAYQELMPSAPQSACYLGGETVRQKRVTECTTSGVAVIKDRLIHALIEDIPSTVSALPALVPTTALMGFRVSATPRL
ncbi:hypothetical protein QZM46_08065 [Burkholderia vietnamiensis]|uniref:Uncharacterized protein n=1 Tax=Burkholderia vietnamiensis TaxID=60552 RepID=A0AAW7SZA6_BURVI|nr:hypothetical protein [Burkholderia vietnamiensis]MBH9645839.1 hypothetical protein [Burkholderia vietnamiensis]MBR8008852.1 hypothetical protein [Burkholderia vietnamiensis]MDN7551290.1 hypothetical protein [Burkholderia vietnamiensis]MDN7795104.1 hypothetical protein [Burkholderia vietnamiensis]MDN8043616.1 hypothetical protein [Burkholderia vietnamiensis]